ncbi:hypothetical protein KCP69_18665 [Salmonella enterica subsp. enterica]|nr:hypothetical protein KCP69_18665 [Salmonella enterica subsp. enterica]
MKNNEMTKSCASCRRYINLPDNQARPASPPDGIYGISLIGIVMTINEKTGQFSRPAAGDRQSATVL